MKSAYGFVCLLTALSLAACSGGHAENTSSTSSGLSGVAFKGVSLAGAEFGVDPYGSGPLPGTFAVNYMYPDSKYASGYTSPAHFVSEGVNTFRLPFRWERLQPTRNAAFDSAELSRLTTTVNDLTALGANVLIDPHNYARYGADLIGSAAVPNSDFADFWSRLATAFKNNPKVMFGLMNEPHDMPTEQWVSAANAAIAAIRATGANNLITVPGNGWTGASSWTQNWYGTADATAMLAITDPGNNYAFEAHEYLDSNGGGGDPACVSGTIGSERLADFTSWLRANGKRGFLGEFGGSSDATCLAAIDDMLKHVEANSDVYLGWTYWAGGPWWGTNWMAIEPVAGVDVPQMTTLIKHLGASAPPPAPSSSSSSSGSSTCTPTTYDATKDMTQSIGSPSGNSWNLWADGYVATTQNFSAGPATIVVKAHGTNAAGVSPHMVVTVDNVSIGDVNVAAASDADYPFSFTATAGSHEIRVAFDNDYCTTTEDRNLYVTSVAVTNCGSGSTAPPAPSAPAATCSPATYDAASMNHSTGGATSGGWNVWGNGYVSTNATFAAGPATITVNAMGSIAAGVWPHMVVSVGGVPIGSASVQTTQWTSYPFSFTATAGTQEVKVEFDNDYCSTTEDRNLFVENLQTSCSSGTQAPAPTPAPTSTSTTPSGGSNPPPPPSSGGAIRIMPLGDSITLGVNGGYRDGLWDRLTTAGKTIDYVGSQSDQYTLVPDHDHEGHPGFTIGNIAASVDGWLATYKPTHVLLLIGTNDVAWWCAQSASEVADANAALIDQILADDPGVWVIVGSITPLTSQIIQPNNVDRAQLAADYDVQLQQRVQSRIDAGKRVKWADTHSVINVSDLYDGVHPTQAAADKMAQVWYDALMPTLP